MACYKVGANVAPAGGEALQLGEVVRIADEDLDLYEALITCDPPLLVEVPCPEDAPTRAAAAVAAFEPGQGDPADESVDEVLADDTAG